MAPKNTPTTAPPADDKYGPLPEVATTDTRTPAERAQDAADYEEAKDRISPIGVTPGYRVRHNAPTSTGSAYSSPLYYEGDEWMFTRNGASPEDVANIQVLLVQAGLLTDEIGIGAWEQKSAAAFRKVLEIANRAGTDWATALQDLADKPSLADMLGGGGSTRAPFSPRVSNPDDLREVFKQTAYNVLGGKFTDDEQLQRFVDTYQQQEINAQRAAYDTAAAGGTTVEQPQADTAALEQLKSDDPAAYGAAQFANYGRMIRDMLTGGAT